MAYESRETLAGKIGWEGGLVESLEYGIRATDMPVGDTELADAWTGLETAWKAMQPHLDRLTDLLGLEI